jgi:hypothetical protein
MKIINSIALLSIGAAFGIGMVLSCGDSSPHRTDAATCDCPASEAPIAGRVVVIEGTPRVIQAGQDGAAGTGCMPGMQFLSGSCQPADPTTLRNITLIQFGFDKVTLNWLCVFKNNEVAPVTVNASVLCLKPPG